MKFVEWYFISQYPGKLKDQSGFTWCNAWHLIMPCIHTALYPITVEALQQNRPLGICHFISTAGHCPALRLPQRRKRQLTPVFLPGESQGQGSLVGCTPWGRKESDTTEWLHFRFSLSCIGEGNGNPLQCSCLENPRDGGPRWAAVYGVAQSRTWLKRLSSSSMIAKEIIIQSMNWG